MQYNVIHVKHCASPETACGCPGRSASVGRKAHVRRADDRNPTGVERKVEEDRESLRQQIHVALIHRRSGSRHRKSPRTALSPDNALVRQWPTGQRPDPTAVRVHRRVTAPAASCSCTTRVPIGSNWHRRGPNTITGRLGSGGQPARLGASHEDAPGARCTLQRRRPSASSRPTRLLRDPPPPRAARLQGRGRRRPRHVRSGSVVTDTGEGEDHRVDSRETRRMSHRSPHRRGMSSPRRPTLLSQ